MKTKLTFFCLIFSILFICCNRYHYDYEKPVKYIHDPITPKYLTPEIKKIVQNGKLMGSAVGYAGTKPKQYEHYEKLLSKASDKDLETLTKHNSPVVRCYAFWGLRKRKVPNLFEIGLNHLNDTAVVSTLSGCIGGFDLVGDVILSELLYSLHKEKQKDKIEYLDSVLLYGDYSIGLVNSAIAGVKSTDLHRYERIHELAKKGNETAIITLAKFQKESDIPLIKRLNKNSPHYFMVAVQKFPHQGFKPYLENYSKKILKEKRGHSSAAWRQFYLATAIYKDTWSLDILQQPLKKVAKKSLQKYYIDQVFNAVIEYKSPIYDDLLFNLWRKWKKANIGSLKYLISRKKEKADEILFTTLEHVEEYRGVDMFSYNEVPLADYLIREAYDREPERTIILTEKQIIESNVHNIEYFTPLISKTKDQRLIDAALKRLEDESNPHVYLNLLGILLELNSQDIKNKISLIVKKNPKLLEGWGGEETKELLDRYGISIK